MLNVRLGNKKNLFYASDYLFRNLFISSYFYITNSVCCVGFTSEIKLPHVSSRNSYIVLSPVLRTFN